MREPQMASGLSARRARLRFRPFTSWTIRIMSGCTISSGGI